MVRKLFFLLAIIIVVGIFLPVMADEKPPEYRYVLLGFEIPDNLSEDNHAEEIEKIGGLLIEYGKKYSDPKHQWFVMLDGKEYTLRIEGPRSIKYRWQNQTLRFEPNSYFEIHSPFQLVEEGTVSVRLRLKLNGEWKEEPGKEGGYGFIIKKIK